MHLLLGAVLAVGVGAATVVLAVVVLGRIPHGQDPAPDHDDDRDADRPAPQVRFGELVRPRFLLGLGVLSAAVAAVATATLPAALWAPWLVLAVGGSLLAAVDGATTWLPNHLMYPTWAATAVALVVVGFLAGPPVALRLLACAAGWGLVFYLVWLLARGSLGFGDVRLAVVLGAGSGASGWLGSYVCLLTATVVGSLWGVGVAVVRRATGRGSGGRHPGDRIAGAGRPRGFAYGLPLFLGCTAGLLVDAALVG